MNSENRLKLKKKTNIKKIIINSIFCMLFIFLSAILFFKSIKINQKTSLKYNQTSNLDYKVKLKNNNYYNEDELDKNMQYIASLIDKIDVFYHYKFDLSEKMNYIYQYSIIADIQITDQNTGNIIFEKKEKILDDNKNEEDDSNSFTLNKDVSIDYQKYNELVKKFKSDYGLSAKGVLNVILNIKVMDEEGNIYKNLDANNNMKVIIPLAEQTINIKLDYKDINNTNTITKKIKLKITDYKLYIAGIVFLIGFIIEIFYIIGLIIKLNKKSKYDVELNKILKEYDRLIAEINDLNVLNIKSIIDIKSFSELLDIRDNLEKPILHYEVEKGKKSLFLVKENDEVYRFILNKDDLK